MFTFFKREGKYGPWCVC